MGAEKCKAPGLKKSVYEKARNVKKGFWLFLYKKMRKKRINKEKIHKKEMGVDENIH